AEAPYGATAALQRMDEAVPKRAGARPPAVGAPQGEPGALESPTGQPPTDLNGGFDQALFAPTDRPTEPITAGAPFGPGANYVPKPYESDRAFALRVADQLEQTPTAGDLGPYINKLRWGS